MAELPNGKVRMQLEIGPEDADLIEALAKAIASAGRAAEVPGEAWTACGERVWGWGCLSPHPIPSESEEVGHGADHEYGWGEARSGVECRLCSLRHRMALSTCWIAWG